MSYREKVLIVEKRKDSDDIFGINGQRYSDDEADTNRDMNFYNPYIEILSRVNIEEVK